MSDPNQPAHPPVAVGNADVDSLPFRSWLMGHFVPEELGLRHSSEVEVKWGRYVPGFGEREWTACRTATTLALLISGMHEIELPHRLVTLREPGDYLLWGPGVPHRWQALSDVMVVCVRWPSTPGDAVEVPDAEVERMRASLAAE